MLAYVAGSVAQTSMFEREWHVYVSGDCTSLVRHLEVAVKSNFFARNSQLISNFTKGHTQTQMIYHQIEGKKHNIYIYIPKYIYVYFTYAYS